MLTTNTIASAQSASAVWPGAPVVRPEGPVASLAGGVRPWSRSRRDASDRGTERGPLSLGARAFEAKCIVRQSAHPYARQNSAGGRDRPS